MPTVCPSQTYESQGHSARSNARRKYALLRDAAYPVDHASLQLSIATYGVPAIGGLAPTAMGVLTLMFP
jgi:hypothetical protein